MNVQEAFEWAKYMHFKKVLTALGPARVKKAMTAFDDGESSWSECFFARAFDGELDLARGLVAPELQIMSALGMKERISIRFVWQSFDSYHKTGMTRQRLEDMCRDVLGEQISADAMKLVKSLQFDENKECALVCAV